MYRTAVARGRFVIGAVIVTLAALAVPAYAQNGGLKGKIMDETGQPVREAVITFEQAGNPKKVSAIADKDGLWFQNGLAAGVWNLTFTKGKLNGKLESFTVKAGQTIATPDVYISEKGGGPRGTGSVVQTNLSAEEAAKLNKEREETEKLLKDANAALEAGQDDAAIEKLTALMVKMDKCAACYARRGDAYVRKGKLDEAEKDYLKSIEIDATQASPYRALANIYNQQKKFDDAVKMSTKANELAGAAGGGDATSVYNLGIILWNQSKAPEAAVQFEKALQLDPKMAEAFYMAGLAHVSSGKNAEAKTRLAEYLKMAPTGPNAATAKALLDSIK
jgi:tetratricopeptide (TPR) repeat protein